MKGGWTKRKLLRLEHELMKEDVGMSTLAELFGVDRSNLHRKVKSSGIKSGGVGYGKGRKDRHLLYQLRRFGLSECDLIPPPHKCPLTNVRLSYDILGGGDNNATVVLENGRVKVIAKKEAKRLGFKCTF